MKYKVNHKLYQEHLTHVTQQSNSQDVIREL